MDSIKITSYYKYGPGEVYGSISENDDVEIKIVYKDAPQTPTISMTSQEWERFVAWVEWQRKDRKLG